MTSAGESKRTDADVNGQADASRVEATGESASGADGAASRGGRPRLLDATKRAEVCALLAAGCTFRAAAQYVGCSVSTIAMLKERDAGFRDQVDKALAQRQLIPLSYVRRASRQSWRAAAWLLERTAGKAFKRDNYQEPSDIEGEAVQDLIAEVNPDRLHGVLLPSKDEWTRRIYEQLSEGETLG